MPLGKNLCYLCNLWEEKIFSAFYYLKLLIRSNFLLLIVYYKAFRI